MLKDFEETAYAEKEIPSNKNSLISLNQGYFCIVNYTWFLGG